MSLAGALLSDFRVVDVVHGDASESGYHRRVFVSVLGAPFSVEFEHDDDGIDVYRFPVTVADGPAVSWGSGEYVAPLPAELLPELEAAISTWKAGLQ